jgi:hypothetical protein
MAARADSPAPPAPPAPGADPAPPALSVRVTQETLPPRDDRHGTPHAMVERVFTFELPLGTAVVDQTDYGHPGRFNPCHARPVPLALQPRTPQLLAAAEALARLL